MFGYVRPFPAEMKVREYEMYRGVYCGVCREIGRTSGQLSRFAITYDIVLLCAVRMELCGIMPEFEQERCPAHPVNRRLTLKPNEATAFTAAAFAALAAAKNDDDLEDERGVRRLKPIVLLPIARHMKKCAGKKLPDGAENEVCELIAYLSKMEKDKSRSADETSDAFGNVLGYIFSLGLDGDAKEIAETVGACVGKFCYMCDAVDDLADDVKRKRYNALYRDWGEHALSEGRVSPMVAEAVTVANRLSLEELGRAVEKLEPSHPMTPIIKNIVYLGLPASLDAVLIGKNKNHTPNISAKEPI